MLGKKLNTLYFFNFLTSFTDDECRIIEFKEPKENNVMTGHVIKRGVVDNPGSCRVMCYMNPNCVSINFGPSHGGKYKCELNNATDEDHLTAREAFTFLAIEVSTLMPKLCVSIVAIFFFCIQRNLELTFRNLISAERLEILRPALLVLLPTGPSHLRKTNTISFFSTESL